MRDSEILDRIQDVAKLQEYLYLNPDSSIQVETGLGRTMTMWMDDKGNVMAKLDNVSEAIPFNYNNMLSLPVWLNIIDQLEEQPAQRSPESFKTRWEEVKFDVAVSRTIRSMRKPARKVG